MNFEKLMIIGTGLIGTSLALAFKETNSIRKISGYDVNKTNSQDALKLGSIDEIENLQDGIPTADIIIFATPVESIKDILTNTIELIKPGTIVSDVGSTKYQIVKIFDSFVDKNINFIGGHPMAGTENSGPLFARKDLFKNKPYVLVKTKKCSNEAFEKFRCLINKIEANPVIMEAQKHDKIVAVTSHLPQIVSFYLAKTLLKEKDEDFLKLVGSGFKDTTRLAKSDPTIWIDIFKQNKENILNSVEIFESQIQNFKNNLNENKYKEIVEELKQVREFRNKL
ncbi:prephenate dehydrogenase/arogenate dehydrogenase family protein [Petrotoga sp. 9PWA.NaAc.5.4]|uniref:prephenate dehydrogenase n=1 Tax=Petrotoga sp. 9PWA.NaAc.5.4 TaxID=1434328 RepID=UPI001304D2EB|nr:prephenate dehydrogenase/arogenate dehydrogenase family protein [Petrotoga sp. 9PWA.NaAc.5.4]